MWPRPENFNDLRAWAVRLVQTMQAQNPVRWLASKLEAGSNITLTYNQRKDTITIASSGGGGGGATDLSYTAATRLLESSTGTDVTLPLVSSSNAGLAPASGGGTTNFLRADGAWAAPPGGGGGGGNNYFPGGWA